MSRKKTPRGSAQRPNVWPRVIVGLVAVLVIGLGVWAIRGASASRATAEVTGAPSLQVDQEKVDFGDVKYNKRVQATFQLTNVGDQTLRISEAPYIEVLEGC